MPYVSSSEEELPDFDNPDLEEEEDQGPPATLPSIPLLPPSLPPTVKEGKLNVRF
jgi:hypothetical protein